MPASLTRRDLLAGGARLAAGAALAAPALRLVATTARATRTRRRSSASTRGAVAAGDVRVVTVHRFRADYVETMWTVTSAGRARRSVDVLFPAWTGAGKIDAVLHDGTRVALGRGPVSLGRVAWLHLRGERSGYVVVVVDRTPMHATARTLATTPQRYEPRPGPTLALRLVRAARFAVAR